MTPENERRLRAVAEQLAQHIDLLTGLTPDERCDLRTLPLALLEIADREAGVETPEPPDMPGPPAPVPEPEELAARALNEGMQAFLAAVCSAPRQLRPYVAATLAGNAVAWTVDSAPCPACEWHRIVTTALPALARHGLVVDMGGAGTGSVH